MQAFLHPFIIYDYKETDQVLIFVHIPKTAGTTLHFIINKQYKDLENKFERWSCDLPLDKKKKIAVIKGHMVFGIHNYLPQPKYTYITLLRNPIDRIISMFYYVRENKKMKEHDWYNQITLYDYVTEEQFNHATFNMQTRYISGKKSADLELAKNNLKKYFSVVGTSERFADTISVLEKELNWKIGSYQNKNVSKNKPALEELPAEIIEILKQKNQKDWELYQLADKLLDDKLKLL